jgi:predicted metal-binding membrane protein
VPNPLAHRSLFVPTLGALVVLAWATLFAWERSPYARYLTHGEPGQFLCQPGTPPLVEASLYLGGWTLMIVAMMLPTTLPLVNIFRGVTRQRDDRAVLVTLLLLGFLATWLAFGVAAHLLDHALRTQLEQSGWFIAHPWVFGAAALALAGAFQFSRLKYRCLDKCRSPLSFVMGHWHGRNPAAGALALGIHHGAFCVGCCWALMLLMFAVGSGSIGWMLALGAAMAIEKNMPWGRRLAAPLGVCLLAWSATIALSHL